MSLEINVSYGIYRLCYSNARLYWFGAIGTLENPYEHRVSLASACNDMLLTILEFLEAKEIEEIYLMGYSEGGYATLSTQ